ncbi:MAG: hypothetical protein GY950_00760 [bacterium]|nr:hypothetical protein [bacterium]
MRRFFLAAALFCALAASVFAKDKFSDATPLFQYWPAYQVNRGAAVPAVCNPLTGDIFMVNAGATAGFYRCSAINTWSRVISDGDTGQTWMIGVDESWVLTTTTGWPAQFRHTGAAGFALSFQNLNTGYTFGDGTYFQLDTAGNFLIVNQEVLNLVLGAAGVAQWTVSADGSLLSAGAAFANLPGAPTNGMIIYCSDCTIANPCAGAGTGAIAKRLNAVWVCN